MDVGRFGFGAIKYGATIDPVEKYQVTSQFINNASREIGQALYDPQSAILSLGDAITYLAEREGIFGVITYAGAYALTSTFMSGGMGSSGSAANRGGGTVGQILAGHSPESMIHLTTATQAELASGVYRGSSWVKLGDVAHMTVPEYQLTVVGRAAAASPGGEIAGFVVSKPGAAMFERVNIPNLSNTWEFVNPTAPVLPDAYVPFK